MATALAKQMHGKSADKKQLKVGYCFRPVEDKEYEFK